MGRRVEDDPCPHGPNLDGSLRKDAKRWLKAVQAAAPAAKSRLSAA